jgi:energy-converting hydrogenase Eha subunit C
MSLASETRRAVRDRPFLLAALRAGVVNYTAAADFLDLDGEREAVATALRRFAEDLPPFDAEPRDVRVTMESGVGVVDADDRGSGTDDHADPILQVGGSAVVDGGSSTAVLATGAVDAAALAAVLNRLAATDDGVEVAAAGVCGESLLVVVGRRDGATALRTVEAALDAVPVGE